MLDPCGFGHAAGIKGPVSGFRSPATLLVFPAKLTPLVFAVRLTALTSAGSGISGPAI